jgi:cation transport protein ChaC
MTALDRTAADSSPPCPPDAVGDASLPDWIFGYGSLIWDPGFEPLEQRLGQVHGYHRAFCIRSTRYRGTPERPGVVLGLDRGGSCIGVALRIRPDARRRTVAALYEREMTGGVYLPRMLSVALGGTRRVQALAFVANRDAAAYERLSDDEILQRLTGCCGQRGRNLDYALRTLHSLAERGVHCPHLGRLGRRLLACDRA